MSEEIEKSIRPEVTKEQLGVVIESLMEAIESMIETPEEDSAETETESEDTNPMAVQEGSAGPSPIGDPDKNPINWPVAKSMDEEKEEESDEDISKKYESDNEEEDKWNNMEKACWAGYKQVGMKDKNGRRVPNCVPVVNKSLWDGKFSPNNFKK